MLTISTILKHYKRKGIQDEMLELSKDREVAVRYGDSGFGKRPNTLHYPRDILEFAKQGATSFHVSEEHWSNVYQLRTDLRKDELDALRTGWDLVIDVDCKDFLLSKIISSLVVESLKEHSLSSISVKFSGNKGFHIGVPFQAFPKTIHDREIRLWFPEGPRRIAAYLIDYIFRKHISLKGDTVIFGDNYKMAISEIAKKTEKPLEEFYITLCAECKREIHPHRGYEFICPRCETRKTGIEEYLLCPSCSSIMEKFEVLQGCDCGSKKFENRFNVSALIEIDTILISSRHLYRMPYSLHEKSGLCSVVIEPGKIMDFEKEQALPERVDTIRKFLDATNTKEGEAAALVLQAFDFTAKVEYKEASREFESVAEAVNKDFFPPCIKKALGGVDDGRKRSLFFLINFLQCVGYGDHEIEGILYEWNKKNREPLREVLIKGQLRYRKNSRKVLPPNCDNSAYYRDIGVCVPDAFCRKIKNPVNYALLKAKMVQQTEKPKREKLTEEQKEMRRKFRKKQKESEAF
ncbi:MAG: hypothetical protein QXK37_02860 [Candidatus Woesearchaeota archaeon]